MTEAVLNVGGGSKSIPIPRRYDGWVHHLLDIDVRVGPDVLCDARHLETLPANEYDAVYCSHNLEHYYTFEVRKVLQGFMHVLKPGGMVEIMVPDLQAACAKIGNGDNPNSVLYMAGGTVGAGGIPVTLLDIIYGSAYLVQQSGQPFMAHKTGFTQATLKKTLIANGFLNVEVGPSDRNALYEIHAVGFKGI